MLDSRFVWWVSLPLILSLAGLCNARIINIPDDRETIQSGIDAAEDGDTVLVQPGIYFENINFEGKAITVASLVLTTNDRAYIDSTIIDGDSLDCVVSFNTEEDSTSVLQGFTIRNGIQDYGGGIDCQPNTGPLLLDLLIKENTANQEGGGIYFTTSASPWVRRTIITRNKASMGGGIATARPGTAHLQDVIIIGNSALYAGGGIIAGGGGSYILDKVAIVNNSAEIGGGVVFVGALGNIFNNVTISGNVAESRGGISMAESTLNLVNCIVWGNARTQIGHGKNLDREFLLQIYYCDIEGGEEGIVISGGAELNWGDGNMDEDSLFIDPDNSDYHLKEDSPCIDAGDQESELDPDGTIADMGAFYFHQRDIDVEPDTLEFIGMQTGITDTLSVLIRNVGLTPLQIYSLMLDDDETPFEIISEVDTFSIEAESESIALITFSSEAQAEYRSTLRIISDDPDEDTIAVPLIGSALDVEDQISSQPSVLSLQPAFPNPYNSVTTISYSLPNPSNLSLVIYNIMGNPVATVFDGYSTTGQHALSWNATNLPSGIYVCRMEAGNVARQVKLVNVK